VFGVDRRGRVFVADEIEASEEGGLLLASSFEALLAARTSSPPPTRSAPKSSRKRTTSRPMARKPTGILRGTSRKQWIAIERIADHPGSSDYPTLAHRILLLHDRCRASGTTDILLSLLRSFKAHHRGKRALFAKLAAAGLDVRRSALAPPRPPQEMHPTRRQAR